MKFKTFFISAFLSLGLTLGMCVGVLDDLVHHESYSVEYDVNYHNPRYVIYMLTKEDVEANHSRTNFKKDPLIPQTISDELYKHTDHHRGHMVPGEDKGAETYFTSNICPQNGTLNTGLWKEIEIALRKRALTGEKLIIMVGPIYSDRNPVYLCLKPSIRIPEAFFKIVYGGAVRETYLIPNQPIANADPKDYLVNYGIVQVLTKIDFDAVMAKFIDYQSDIKK